MKQAANRLVQGAGYIAGAAVVLILVLVCIEVIARQFGASTQVADEFAGYLNAIVIFLGVGYALKEGAFIRVEIVYDKLKGATRNLAQWIIVVTSLIFAVVLTYFLAMHTLYAFEQDIRAVSVVETPEWLPMLVVTIGCLILVVQLVMFLVTRFKNLP
ncbi:TRAP transporter small permease [Alcaligenaceae bacterium LF4-65]|jgi:TRAP-type C4-dicarboxylate transport system permease small subunit|uniref:TRAP transporter small permease protein n=1 Tax=Zwartia hollandica TaxID=324606 RepID=A0A953NBV2_9BURK|nr:TRAP transporter small permease [Zwartia hollandica]MBZ1351492.1 TRAP transporter small permease [Zwartia hollandica]